MMLAHLDEYRSLIALDEPFLPPAPAPAAETPHLIAHLVRDLLTQTSASTFAPRQLRFGSLSPRDQLKALLTLRLPEPFLSPDFHFILDQLLQYEQHQRKKIDVLLLPTIKEAYPTIGWREASRCALWQGDIITLRADAIVNAANATLLGCFQPFHTCIDNAIHSIAGPRLREDCQQIMELQGMDEPTGTAKITRGYNLPASFVVHTVGPIYQQATPHPSEDEKAALAASYWSCLELAAQFPAIRSLAFCCISTGVFGFPQQPAAAVAFETVRRWLTQYPDRFDRIIFNVFGERDREIYQRLFSIA